MGTAARRAWAAGLTLMSGALMWSASAQAAPFDLAWSAPEGCPSRERIMAATRAHLAEPETSAPPELFVEGTVTVSGAAFVVTLVLKDAHGGDLGERRVHVNSAQCEAVEEPASLVLAMMIAVARPPVVVPEARHSPGNEGQLSGPSRLPSMPPSPPSPPLRSPRSPRSPSSAARPVRALRLAVGAAGVASVGVLPDAGRGAALRLTLSPRPIFVFGFETAFETGSSARAGEGQLRFRMLTGALTAGTVALRTHRFELAPHVSLRGGVIHAMPVGFPIPGQETRPILLTGAGVSARLRLSSRVYLEALPALEFVLLRDQFEVRDRGQLIHVHQAAVVEGRMSIGFGYEFR